MRIVQLIDSLDYGGAEQVVANLSAVQAREGDEVRLVCLRGLGAQPVDTGALKVLGVEIVALEKPDGFDVRTLRRLAGYLRSERIDVVHSHNHIVHHYAATAGRISSPAGTCAITGLPFRTSIVRGSARMAVSQAGSQA